MGVAVLRDWTSPLDETSAVSKGDLDGFRGLMIGVLISVLIWSASALVVIGI